MHIVNGVLHFPKEMMPYRTGAVLADGSVRLTVETLRADAGLVMR